MNAFVPKKVGDFRKLVYGVNNPSTLINNQFKTGYQYKKFGPIYR